tara:strand:- start:2426 stop:3070 length:645 start_codon:yes stop_codon:yes gene_type:complete
MPRDLGSKVRRLAIGPEQQGYFVTEHVRVLSANVWEFMEVPFVDIEIPYTRVRIEQGTLRKRTKRVKRSAVYDLIFEDGKTDVYVINVGINPLDNRHLDESGLIFDVTHTRLPLEGLEQYVLQTGEVPIQVDGTVLENAIADYPLTPRLYIQRYSLDPDVPGEFISAQQWREETPDIAYKPIPEWRSRATVILYTMAMPFALGPFYNAIQKARR